jgi:uncharacterized protein (UPF0262 family)
VPDGKTARLIAVTLDDSSIGRGPPEIEHERRVAVYDLIEDNTFLVEGHAGPYRLAISLIDRRLVLDVRSQTNRPLVTHALSLTPFRKIVKDYFLICESYHRAIRTGSPSRIEAIDMGRRGLHDEASQILVERLRGKISLDAGTARRLFTLICALHWRG